MDPNTCELQKGDYVKIRKGTVPPKHAGTDGTIYEINEHGEHWLYVQGGERCPYLRHDLTLVCRNNKRI